MAIAIKIGTTSWRAAPQILDVDEVLFEGDFIYAADKFTPLMVWDDLLQNVRQMTKDEIAQKDAEKSKKTKEDAVSAAGVSALAKAVIATPNLTNDQYLTIQVSAMKAVSVQVATP